MNDKLHIIDAMPVLSFAMKRWTVKDSGLTKGNLIVGVCPELISLVEKSQATHAVVLFDKNVLESIYEKSSIPVKNLQSQIEGFEEFVAAAGLNIIKLEDGGIVDCMGKLIAAAKQSNLCVSITSDDILLTRFVDEVVDLQFYRSLSAINQKALGAIVGVESSQVLDFIRLIGIGWYQFVIGIGWRPTKKIIPNIGVAAARKFLKKYSSIINIFEDIDRIPPKIAASLIAHQDHLVSSDDSSLLGQLYSRRELVVYEGEIVVDSLKIKLRDYQSLIGIYKKFSLSSLAERMEAEVFRRAKGISFQAAMAAIRRENIQEDVVCFEISEKHRDTPVVYRIKNSINGRMYFGSTNNLEKRAKKHLDDLQVSLHHNPELNKDYKKYGRSCFSLKVLGSYDSLESARKKEQLYVDIFYGRACCYNYNPFADESAQWSKQKKAYTVCAVDVLSKKYKNPRGSVHESGQGTWLSIHAAIKDLKINKSVVSNNFQKACESGGEYRSDGWRYIIRDLQKKH